MGHLTRIFIETYEICEKYDNPFKDFKLPSSSSMNDDSLPNVGLPDAQTGLPW